MGFHDEGNLIATIITSRSLNVILIFVLAFFSQFAGTLFFGTKVAMGTVYGLFDVKHIQQNPNDISRLICAAMIGAIIWNLVTWYFQIPSSSSHAIVGGLLGPFVVKYGICVVNPGGILLSVLLPLLLSPVIGYFFGYAIYKLNRFCFGRHDIKVRKLFQASQTVTCVMINAFQGSNDAQKGMSAIVLLMMGDSISGIRPVPEKMIFFSALTIAMGLVLGGMKMIKGVGKKIYSVRLLHSISAQMSSLLVISSSSLLGFPISGTQIVNSAILGVGAADRPSAVGWTFAKNMLKAWAITIPVSFLLSAGLYYVFFR